MINVMAAWLSWLVVLQPEASSPVPDAGGGAANNSPVGCAMNAGLIAVMIAVFYFLILRPQQKQQKSHDAMLKALQKGVVVRTRGGLRGEITQVLDKEVVLMIAERVKVNVLKSHVSGVEGTPEAGGDNKGKSE